MKIHKVHFWVQDTTYCGCLGSNLKVSTKWRDVTCKNCLKAK